MESFLMHYGIAGQKWGVRRYQNEDGTLTEEGRQRYLDSYRDDYIQAQVYKSLFEQYSKDPNDNNAVQAKRAEQYGKYYYDMFKLFDKAKKVSYSDVEKWCSSVSKKHGLTGKDLDELLEYERSKISG